ncbi:DNA-binding protein WhiA [Corynebacterium sp. CCM 8835]|uniref:Probable cell division protein WhiA n=1 Tax=Corynebacterium antarcticum TaxID=2800405 RepID=A0A9Q4GLU4_9CORY|nr:DNA-binding protein WhiA [Corynebacterium antarcticum]MCK7641475.1 DNA-binding protein WhiA [Corynebacterium antarcticum]MCK7660427.1 DNA-binding protein WhiA [Corynebacterium antarcticum]MCL0244703.1 DNA-binding protein WhiA [Corynebacterium antarcticum]MCX7537101.1 DNA-binding protein WhiA [Corynebacterium antarcticum]
MALTTRVKEELGRVTVRRDAPRNAELASLLRFSATLQVVGDRLVIEAEVESMDIARRIRDSIRHLYGHEAVIHAVGSGGGRRTRSYTVTVTDGARDIARRVGLVSPSGHLVRGLPPRVVSGTVSDAEAAWRGAFLVHGSLTEPGRSSALEVACPCPEAALALVGCARRLGITAKTKESRGTDRVSVRDSEAIGALLTRMGAQRTRLEWEEQRTRREVRASTNRLANFDDANLRRSARAAVAAAARVERALEILGDDVPDHLAEAGQLRVQHRQASLEELGRLADPQMTKDAVAGRIRRLLSMADRRAAELGVPKTTEAVKDSLFTDNP